MQAVWWRMSNRGSEYRITQPRGGIKYPESTEGAEHMPRVVRKGPGEGRSKGKGAKEDMQSVRGEWFSLFTRASHRKSHRCWAGKKQLSCIRFDLICMAVQLESSGFFLIIRNQGKKAGWWCLTLHFSIGAAIIPGLVSGVIDSPPLFE